MSTAALHAEISGPADGAVLVLGSSLGTTNAMWDPLAGRLARRHRLVRYDHRGHGASPLPAGRAEIGDLGRDVLALLDRLEIERASYAGVSLGGMVGIWLAAHAPERIERLIGICTSVFLPPAEAWAQRAALVRDAGDVGVLSAAVLERWFTPAFAAAAPETVAWMEAMLRACPPAGYAACCEVVECLDLRGDLAAIVAPTLVIAAAQDPATPPEHGELIAAGIAGARLEVLARGAHLALIEHPDGVAVLIERHLEAADG